MKNHLETIQQHHHELFRVYQDRMRINHLDTIGLNTERAFPHNSLTIYSKRFIPFPDGCLTHLQVLDLHCLLRHGKGGRPAELMYSQLGRKLFVLVLRLSRYHRTVSQMLSEMS